MRVVVRAPATIANLGPGFDCLGVALSWHNEVRVEKVDSDDLTVTASGQGAGEVPRDETNLVVRAIASRLGSPRGLRVHLTNAIPFGRGFGSSSAAIVAGLVAARALEPGGTDWEPGALVAEAASMEGHADNVAPCVLGGGAVVSGTDVLALGVPSGIEAIVCVAPMALSTEVARRVLPSDVPFAEAAATAGRAALLAVSLARGETDYLLAATADTLHQPARFALAPDAGTLVGALRREGIAAFLAGAGPSVGALIGTSDAETAERAAARLAPAGWEVRRFAIDPNGAMVVEGAGSEA